MEHSKVYMRKTNYSKKAGKHLQKNTLHLRQAMKHSNKKETRLKEVMKCSSHKMPTFRNRFQVFKGLNLPKVPDSAAPTIVVIAILTRPISTRDHPTR